MPRYRSARSIESWRSCPTRQLTAGAPASPAALTSQPAFSRTRQRAAERPAKLAIVAPVTKPTSAVSGKPSRSRNQCPAAASITAVAGVAARRNEFWSQALTSQSAAMAAGRVPPMTQPKKRPEGIAMRPGSALAAR
ncbi:hypothetical protein D9M72_487860 [compost metagenome]